MDKNISSISQSFFLSSPNHEWLPTARTSQQYSIHRAISVALSVQSCSCNWKRSYVVVVLQTRVSTNNFQPLFSLFINSRPISWACCGPCVDRYWILDSASSSLKFVLLCIHIVASHDRRHHFQHLLCFCRPVYCDSVSFPLSGQCNKEKMLHSYFFGVAVFFNSSFLDVSGRL